MEPYFLPRTPGGQSHQLRPLQMKTRGTENAHTQWGRGVLQVWVCSLRSGAFLHEVSTLLLTALWPDLRLQRGAEEHPCGGHTWRHPCVLWVAAQEIHAEMGQTRSCTPGQGLASHVPGSLAGVLSSAAIPASPGERRILRTQVQRQTAFPFLIQCRRSAH